MSQDNRENFGVKILDQHWRVTGESGRGVGGGGGGGREGGGAGREGKKRQKGYVEGQIK